MKQLTKEELVKSMGDAVIEYARVYNEHFHTTLIEKVIIDAFCIGFLTSLEDIAGYPEEMLDDVLVIVSDNITGRLKI